ncbi:alpha/beta hydrolase [Clostridium sp. 'deep sea']|uniref:alpha/beta fold hydrolase n=1 Tax=Clostridium sp. 'deep sea' TaxID=2779445 RepID=UPI0018969EB1|nr:alpha/beta hydrolase [Clostridium sp. 'deep sea']QOR36464.1 alpha/beta hydrolase [Clostridium sp. 'deep sea']
MSEVLFLSGYACKPLIWSKIKHSLNHIIEPDFLEWPKEQLANFTDINDYVNWVNDIVKSHNYHTVVGHSMGGLVALKLAEINLNIKQVIFIESFIKSPQDFFQNLLMEHTNKKLKAKIITMLKKEQGLYSPILGSKLKQLNVTEQVLQLRCSLHAVYGDRGLNDYHAVEKELNWSAPLKDKIALWIINNSCHFPMLENPTDLAMLLNRIIKY